VKVRSFNKQLQEEEEEEEKNMTTHTGAEENCEEEGVAERNSGVLTISPHSPSPLHHLEG